MDLTTLPFFQKAILMSTLDDHRYDLASDRWNTEVRSLFTENREDRSITFTGHKLSLKTNFWNGSLIPEKLAPIKVTGEVDSHSKLDSLMEELMPYTRRSDMPDVSINLKNLLPKTDFPASFTEKSSIGDIIESMMGLGWHYADIIKSDGYGSKVYRHFRFERWDWHELRVGGPISFPQVASANALWNKIIFKASQVALKAWEDFPDAIPHMDATGRIKKDEFKTRIAFKA